MQQQTLNEEVASEIRAGLGRRGLNASDLAALIGMNKTSLSRRLNSNRDFTTGEIQQIFFVLDIPRPVFGDRQMQTEARTG